MKRLFALALIATGLSIAASWDGTKGNLTVTTTATPSTTTLRVADADTTCRQFAVAVLYQPEDGSSLRTLTVLSPYTRIIDSRATASVLLPLSESSILWFSITEIQPGQAQAFGR